MSDPPSSLVIRPWSFVLRPWSFVLSPSLLAPGFVRLSRGSQHDGPRDTGQRTKDRGPKTKDGFPTTGHKPSGGYQCQSPRLGKAPSVATARSFPPPPPLSPKGREGNESRASPWGGQLISSNDPPR